MPDRYPDNLFEEIRRLTARIDALEAQLRQRPGVTQASQGWLLSDMAIPSVSAGQCQIGCNSSEFYAATSSGVKRLFLQAAATSTQVPLETDASAPGSYSTAWGQRVRNDLVNTRATAFAIQDVLRTAGIMAT